MEFDMPKEQNSIIKVIGVGGGGGNAVNHMFNQGIKGVDFVICNTDHQALDISPVPIKIQIGASLTEGRGAGAKPEVGKSAAIENIDDIRDILAANTKMVFITAGMGGGTGTGGAPVIARVAKEMGILTVGIVTIPFSFEGKKRKQQAELGLEDMRKSVDTLLVINNDKLREMFGNLTLATAFSQADDVLARAAKGIAEMISRTGYVNVDFNDVSTVMKDSGVAIMGSATAEGEGRSIKAVKNALASPLLNDNDIHGAKFVLLNITYGSDEILMDEIGEITDYIQEQAGSSADVIWGHGKDESLGSKICVTVIATGFNLSPTHGLEKAPDRTVINLEADVPTMITQPVQSPVQTNVFSEPVAETRTEQTDEPFIKIPAEEKQTQIDWNFTSESAKNDEAFAAKSSDSVMKKEEETEMPKVVRMVLTDDADEPTDNSTNTAKKTLSQQEQAERAQLRLQRIQMYTEKLKSSSGINSLEAEPAYKRRNIQLDDVQHSSEDKLGKFSISASEQGEKKQVTLKTNNSFLHDQPD